MRIVRDVRELGDPAKARVVTLGNFDGVHLAHQELLRRVVETARAQGAAATAVTFDPHPVKILAPDQAPKLLTTLRHKIRLIENEGIDVLVVLRFNQELAHLSPSDFVRNILVEKLRATVVHVGSNFRFGYRRAGNISVLGELARQEGFRLEVLSTLKVRGERVSTSRIRELLEEGRVHVAYRLLGRPFSVSGHIVAGLGVGRQQTVPTLNLAPVEEQLPKIGVYVTRTSLGGLAHNSATNVGHKPTFGEHPLTVESFLLNFAGQINETDMEVEFLYRLRNEIKFPNPAALKAQIQKDARRSVKFFRLLGLASERKTQHLAL